MFTVSAAEIRIRLECHDSALIAETVQKIIDTVREHGTEANVITVAWCGSNEADSLGPVPQQVHTRSIEISNPTPKSIDVLLQLELPEGVELAVSL